MFLVRFFLSLLSIPISAVIGDYLGDKVRSQVMGEPVHPWRLVHETPEGQKVIGVNPRLTTFVPAVVAGILGKPGFLSALLTGFLLSFYFGNKLERPFWSLVDRYLVLQGDR